MSSTVPTASGSHITAQAPHISHDADILSISTINHAADRQTQITVVPKSFLRQIFGLNPFKTSYFALFRQLDDFNSRACLACGTVLAIAAGVPLPIIGVIFAKLIDSFPPSDEELNLRLKQLLGVGRRSTPLSGTRLMLYSCCLFCDYMGVGNLLEFGGRKCIT